MRASRREDAGGTMRSRARTMSSACRPVPASATLTRSNGAKVGYVALKDFIIQDETSLTTRLDAIKADGATELIVDLRYNGGGRISTAWSGDDRGRGLSATVAGRASDSVQWLLTASGHRAHGLQTRGDIDTPDTRRTTANPQHDRDTALLGKLVFQPDGWQKHVFTLEQVDKESSVNLLSSRAPLPLGGTPAQQAAAVMDERAESTSTRQRLTWDARYQINTALANEVRTVLGVQRASARQLGTSDLYRNPDRVRDVFYEETTWQAGIQASQSTSLDNGWARKLTWVDVPGRKVIRQVDVGRSPHGVYTLDHAPRQ